MRVVVTGGRGMLGTEVCAAFAELGDSVYPLGSKDADITDYTALRAVILPLNPDIVIHCAAMTDVDGCERDTDSAYRINAIGAWNVAAIAEELGAKLVSISTDFVFDGAKTTPYTEFDAVNPLGAYGASKLAGENLTREACRRTYIVRTSWLFGATGKCFPKTILRLARSRPTFNVVADQIGCPTYVVDLAEAITDIVKTPHYGIYHIANSGIASWHEFAEAIVEEAGITSVTIAPIPAARWPSPTTRPQYSVLRSYARELQGKTPLRHWRDALKEFVSKGIPE